MNGNPKRPRVFNKAQLKRMYEALDKMRGLAKSNITESTTIDVVLYGENGAWRGTPTKHECGVCQRKNER